MRKILFVLAFLGVFVGTNAKDYAVDKAASNVAFSVSHLKIGTAKGVFKDFDGVVSFENGEFKALTANVVVASVDTANKTRDNHLQEDDFFKAKTHPKLTFSLTKYEKITDTKGKMTGILSIAGISKEATLDAEITAATQEKLGFTLKGVIKRSEFKFAPNSGTTTLGDEVALDIKVEAKAE